MNTIATVPASRGELAFLDIQVDGKPLSQHFVGRLGGHPSQVSPLGWSSATTASRAGTVAQFLAQQPSELQSGRVPVLVCEECGDLACGAVTVRIVRESDRIVWTDWSYENGYESERPLEWATQPGDFVFNPDSYDTAIRKAL